MTEIIESKSKLSLTDIVKAARSIKGGMAISFGTGIGLGIIAKLSFPEQAYYRPDVGIAYGFGISVVQWTKPKRYALNIVSSEAGYYAGVAATDLVLRLIR